MLLQWYGFSDAISGYDEPFELIMLIMLIMYKQTYFIEQGLEKTRRFHDKLPSEEVSVTTETGTI